MFDILVAGEINPDLILSGQIDLEFGQTEKLLDAAVLAIGSSSVIFACGAARLGLRVAFIGKCGDDVFGRYMLEQMEQHGIDIHAVIVAPGQATGISVIFNRGADRAIWTHPGLIAALEAKEISDELLKTSRHLHVASYFLQTALAPDLPALFRRARSLGLTTSLDTNYDPSEAWQGFDELLSFTDVFLPNEKEALSLTRTGSVDQAADRLQNRIETLAMKLGEQGALGVRAGKQALVPSIPVQVVDTIGAGDSFDAGFLYGYLAGWPLEKSLRLGTVCGALSTQRSGGTAGQPTLEEALRYS
jgi:sugar/nucleoside kinase (ribokinase family)